MAVDKTYRCNLCRDMLNHDAASGFRGVGIWWHEHPVKGWQVKPWRETDNHLCFTCAASIADMKYCRDGVNGCGGGMACRSDHK